MAHAWVLLIASWYRWSTWFSMVPSQQLRRRTCKFLTSTASSTKWWEIMLLGCDGAAARGNRSLVAIWNGNWEPTRRTSIVCTCEYLCTAYTKNVLSWTTHEHIVTFYCWHCELNLLLTSRFQVLVSVCAIIRWPLSCSALWTPVVWVVTHVDLFFLERAVYLLDGTKATGSVYIYIYIIKYI